MLIVLAVICVYLFVLTARLKARADRQQELIDELRSRLDALADTRPGAASAPAAEIPAGRGGIGPELRSELRELKRRGSRDAAVYEFCKATGLDEAAAEQYLNGL